MTLKIALNYAVRELGILDRNPIANLKKPSASKAEQHIPTLPELKRLLEAAKETPSYAFIFLAIATSMRFGELTALSWHDVDLKQGMLYVRQGVGTVYDDESESGYRREVTDTKSTAGRRRIDLSPEAIGVLKEHRKVQDGQPNRHDLAFPNSDGGFIDPSNFHRHAWRPLLKAAGMPHCRFHTRCVMRETRCSHNRALACRFCSGRLGIALRTSPWPSTATLEPLRDSEEQRFLVRC